LENTQAVVFLIIGAIPGTFYLIKSKMELDYEPFWRLDITAFFMIIAAVLTCGGFWIYQERIHDELEAQLKCK
jgi:Ni,Fe-hydrogenase I cytochrome b subunit